MKLSKHSLKCGVLVAGLLTSSLVSAASVTIDFAVGGSASDGVGKNGYGNSITFSEGGLSATATGYGMTGGLLNTYLETAEVSRWDTGLGVCNQSEGTVNAGFLQPKCSTFGTIISPDEHQIDSNGADDYIVLSFDQAVSFSSAVIDPFQIHDRDVKFWIGNVDLLAFNLGGLDDTDIELISGMGSAVTKTATASALPLTVGLDDLYGNVLILKGLSSNDFFKFSSITVETVVPVPAAAWMFGSALLGLAGLKRKR